MGLESARWFVVSGAGLNIFIRLRLCGVNDTMVGTVVQSRDTQSAWCFLLLMRTALWQQADSVPRPT
jgi:hypothetical protein